jgi:hypothetical protein
LVAKDRVDRVLLLQLKSNPTCAHHTCLKWCLASLQPGIAGVKTSRHSRVLFVEQCQCFSNCWFR